MWLDGRATGGMKGLCYDVSAARPPLFTDAELESFVREASK
jgi:hypothetical protein